jgi:hypothetical protein
MTPGSPGEQPTAFGTSADAASPAPAGAPAAMPRPWPSPPVVDPGERDPSFTIAQPRQLPTPAQAKARRSAAVSNFEVRPENVGIWSGPDDMDPITWLGYKIVYDIRNTFDRIRGRPHDTLGPGNARRITRDTGSERYEAFGELVGQIGGQLIPGEGEANVAEDTIPKILAPGEGAVNAADDMIGLPPAAEAAVRFQNQVDAAARYFREDPSRVLSYGGSYRLDAGLPRPVSMAQLQAASVKPTFAQVLVGNAMEARVFEQILLDPEDHLLFDQLSGGGRIDFVGIGRFEDLSFELTTEADASAHVLARPYLNVPGAMIFRYPSLP